MIDLRSHILDGTPCGPQSFADSLEMCRAAISDGVTTIVATPLWEAGNLEPPLTFHECRRKLYRLAAETHGALSFKLGFVLRFSPELPKLVARYGSELTLAGRRHLLVSLPAVEIPAQAEDVWKSLARAGFSVLLAHPECNTVLRRDPDRLANWVAEGLMIQVDAASVLGSHGREVQRFARETLRRQKGHAVVASNARWGASQKYSLGGAREELSGKMGARAASGFTRETPAALITDGGRRRNGVKDSSSRTLTSLIRTLGPIKVFTGES